MTNSFKKWPAEIEIHNISTSVSNPELNLYLISGIMNTKQYDTLKERMPITSDFEISKDKWAISIILTYRQLVEIYTLFTKLANEWRGQYYVITNLFVDACKPFMS